MARTIQSDGERRSLACERTRPKAIAKREDQPAAIEGYGAVFWREGDPTTEYELWQDTYERILPGAFADSLQADVRSLFNHDPNWVLGRSASDPPTLEISEDACGLKYRTLFPDTQAVRDQVLGPIQRGDVSGSSFMFWPLRVSWIEEDRNGRQVSIRQLVKVELLEVGPVTFPAYTGTTAGLRVDGVDVESLVQERDRYTRPGQRQLDAAAEDEAVAVRLRQIALSGDADLWRS